MLTIHINYIAIVERMYSKLNIFLGCVQCTLFQNRKKRVRKKEIHFETSFRQSKNEKENMCIWEKNGQKHIETIENWKNATELEKHDKRFFLFLFFFFSKMVKTIHHEMNSKN